MRAFSCPVCQGIAVFGADRCESCGVGLGLHLPSRAMVAVQGDAALIDGQEWVRCTQAGPLGCNWLTPATPESPQAPDI